jgi:glutathione S-transferase
MSDPQQPILHHFEASPFSEKIRVIFGFKRVAWQSVLIPRILPKPDLMPLTGGYRRTPVMQIGAEVFCDTRAIIRELEARYPNPTLFPHGNAGLPWIVGEWTDRAFFLSTVNLVFGSLGDKVPQSFIEDRTRLRGAPFDVKAMTAGLPHHRDQVRDHLRLIETQLAGDKASGVRPWLLGDFSLADVSAYMNVWYIRTNLAKADDILAEFPLLRDWEGRVRAVGHGQRTDISTSDALTIAKQAKPPTSTAGDANDPGGRKLGARVAVVADEAVRTEVAGEVVAISADHIAICRQDPALGEIVVHFPRIGYQVVAR